MSVCLGPFHYMNRLLSGSNIGLNYESSHLPAHSIMLPAYCKSLPSQPPSVYNILPGGAPNLCPSQAGNCQLKHISSAQKILVSSKNSGQHVNTLTEVDVKQICVKVVANWVKQEVGAVLLITGLCTAALSEPSSIRWGFWHTFSGKPPEPHSTSQPQFWIA